MYSLDVNFLKDRPGRVPEPGLDSQTSSSSTSTATTPLIVGVVVGLLLPGLVGGLWFFLQQQNAKLDQELMTLKGEIQKQQIEKQKITALNKQIGEVNAETTALATVFNQVKPWSAMLQDIRERIPPGVQIKTIEQTEVAPTNTPTPTPAPSAAAPAAGATPAATNTPRPAVNLKISGTARSFDDVNYFLLTLQRSSFFKGDETQLLNAQLIANPTKLEVPQAQNQSAAPANQVKYELPKVVEYTIQTSLSDIPASELLRELDRKGAVGLVTRIRTLQEITKE